MAVRSSLDMLIDLATEERDSATRALGQLRTEQRKSEEQLEALLAYRSEYQRRFDAAMGAGISMASLHNYRRFVASLDKAIEQQRGIVAADQSKVANGKTQWQSRQRRLQSFDTLAVRRNEIARQAATRHEQHLNDEFASRASARGNGFQDTP